MLLTRGEEADRERANELIAAARQTAQALGLVRLGKKLAALLGDEAPKDESRSRSRLTVSPTARAKPALVRPRGAATGSGSALTLWRRRRFRKPPNCAPSLPGHDDHHVLRHRGFVVALRKAWRPARPRS